MRPHGGLQKWPPPVMDQSFHLFWGLKSRNWNEGDTWLEAVTEAHGAILMTQVLLGTWESLLPSFLNQLRSGFLTTVTGLTWLGVKPLTWCSLSLQGCGLESWASGAPIPTVAFEG